MGVDFWVDLFWEFARLVYKSQTGGVYTVSPPETV